MAFLDKLVSPFFSSKEAQAKAIVHCVAIENGAVGFFTAQIPGDKFIITGAQIEMVNRIARVYNVRLDRANLVALIEAALAMYAGPMLAAEGANQVVKYIPGYGNISNTAVASAITEFIGFTCIEWFENEEWFKKIEK
ncbi:MAG: hypothetical protein J5826_06270 [Bacteroidales bacterium]|nr:hypothetical protein [Bacteroidales bacterium]